MAAALIVLAAPAAAQEPDIEASVHGLILMNAFHTTDNVNNSDVPQFAIPPGMASPAGSASSATVRQSRVTAFALVPEFAGGVLEGELDVDFFGGQQPSSGGRTFPLLRVRRADPAANGMARERQQPQQFDGAIGILGRAFRPA